MCGRRVQSESAQTPEAQRGGVGGKGESTRGRQRMCGQHVKRGQMEVRWLLTNRKHGGKTKSVSVLKAALKNGGMEGENRKVGC